MVHIRSLVISLSRLRLHKIKLNISDTSTSNLLPSSTKEGNPTFEVIPKLLNPFSFNSHPISSYNIPSTHKRCLPLGSPSPATLCTPHSPSLELPYPNSPSQSLLRHHSQRYVLSIHVFQPSPHALFLSLFLLFFHHVIIKNRIDD